MKDRPIFSSPGRALIAVLIAAACLLEAGCTTGAQEGAAKGGAMGFVGGLAAGAVNGLLFGDGALEGAVQGAIGGAAAGAASGAVYGGAMERNAGKPAPPVSGKGRIEEIRKKQGDLNFQAAAYVVQCQHDAAIKMANRARQESAATDRQVFALTVRAIAEVESGRHADAEKTYAEIAALDKARPVDKARADTLQALLKIQGLRKENGLKPCGA